MPSPSPVPDEMRTGCRCVWVNQTLLDSSGCGGINCSRESEIGMAKNHVIFLGAGASASSGYPLANGLRLRLCSEEVFWRDLFGALNPHNTGYQFEPYSGNQFKEQIRLEFREACATHLDAFSDSIKLFRDGGFATVDEFSKHASKSNPKYVDEMKKLTRLALAFHNPEDKFHESDYYPFIQRLFRDDNLHELKSHITILSYNYDCYLEFLLLRAFQTRHTVTGHPNYTVSDINQLTSGFYVRGDSRWVSPLAKFHWRPIGV